MTNRAFSSRSGTGFRAPIIYKRGMQKQDEVKLACLFIVLIPPVFGMLELAWGAGLISSVALYLTFKEMLGGDEPV